MMKHIFTLVGLLIIFMSSCMPEVQTLKEDMDFGIFETTYSRMLPDSVRDQLSDHRIHLSEDVQDHVIGYCVSHDKLWRDSLREIGILQDIRVAVTAKPMDDKEMYFTIVALKLPAFIDISDIKEAIDRRDHIEIHFNIRGAKKWAEMTERNINKQVAFLVDGQVYNIPHIAASIKSGAALITGLEAEEAERLAGFLNGEE